MTDDSRPTKTRRQFASTTAMAALSAAIVPSRVFGAQAPSNKLNIAAIGIGGMGGANLKACEGENIVALCDVDQRLRREDQGALPAGDGLQGLPRDAREGEEHRRGGDRDARPHARDRSRWPCLQAGKHVYCQKPLTHTVDEARKITEAARRYKVVTQMGNQGHSFESMRLLKEWIDDGAIGNVTEVHAWTRPAGRRRPVVGLRR